MKSIRDFISHVASCKDTNTLNEVASNLIKTSIFDEEKNTRISSWVQEGKEFKSLKTHLIFMLQIAERSSQNLGVGSLEDFYERVFVCEDTEHLKRIVSDLRTKNYLSPNQTNGMADLLQKAKPFEVVRRNLLILLDTAKKQRNVVVPTDLEARAKKAGDKNFSPPATNKIADLPPSEQQRLYHDALREGLRDTIDRYVDNTLDRVSVYQDNPDPAKMENIRSNVHCLIELLQNQTHVDFVKSNKYHFAFGENRLKKLRKIQDFLNSHEANAPLNLWYEYFRFSLKCDVTTPWNLGELARDMLNEKFEPRTLYEYTYTGLFIVGHPNFVKIAKPSKYIEDRLSNEDIIRMCRLGGKNILALLSNKRVAGLINYALSQLKDGTEYPQVFWHYLLPYIRRDYLEAKLKIMPEHTAKQALKFYIILSDLGYTHITADSIESTGDFEDKLNELFKIALKETSDSIEAFSNGKKTTAQVVITVEKLLKLLKVFADNKVSASGEYLSEVQSIQRFLESNKAGKKLPVLWYYARTSVANCLSRNRPIEIHSHDEFRTTLTTAEGTPSFYQGDFISTTLLASFLTSKLEPSKDPNNIDLIRAAFLFYHPDRESLVNRINQMNSAEQLRNLFTFGAEHSLTELTDCIVQNRNFNALAALRYAIQNQDQSAALLALQYVPRDKLLALPSTVHQFQPLSAAIHRNMPIVVKAIHDKVSQNGKNWQELFAILPHFITNHAETAISIIAVLPRHFFFTPTKDGMLLPFAKASYDRSVEEAIRQKLFSGTELERVIQARKARMQAASSTALGLVSEDVEPQVDILDSPRSREERPRSFGDIDSGCTIV